MAVIFLILMKLLINFKRNYGSSPPLGFGGCGGNCTGVPLRPTCDLTDSLDSGSYSTPDADYSSGVDYDGSRE